MSHPYGTRKPSFKKPKRSYTGIIILILVIATAISFFSISWYIREPPQNTIQIRIGLTPTDIYPIKLGKWEITIQLGATLNKNYNPPLNCDSLEATNGNTKLQDFTMLGLIRQIMEHDGTAPTFTP